MHTKVEGDISVQAMPGLRKIHATPFLFILPLLVLWVTMVFYPLGYSLYLSLHDVTAITMRSPKFIGIENYIELLRSRSFWNSVWVTIVFAMAVPFLQAIVGFAVGLTLSSVPEIYRKISMVLILSPILIPPIVTAAMWRLILLPDIGFLNYMGGLVGMSSRAWLGGEGLTLPVVILLETWRGSPIAILFFLAGFVSLPPEPVEAARIDGAGYLQQLWFIVIPLLKRIILIVLLLRVIETLKTFDMLWGLTRGGPGEDTNLLSIWAYVRTIQHLDIGYGAAISYVEFFFAAAISVFYIWRIEKSAD